MRTPNTMTAPIILISVLALGASAAHAKSKSAPVAVTEVGKPISCVNTRQIKSTKVIDSKTIDFKMRNGDVLRNTMRNSCPNLKFEESFSYRLSTPRLCSVDIIRVLESGHGAGISQGAACGLGKFQKVVPTADAPQAD